MTGLNRSTVADLVAELVEHGLAHEERGDSLGTPGRPSPLVHATPEGAVVLAIEHRGPLADRGPRGARRRCRRPVRARSSARGPPTLDQTLADLLRDEPPDCWPAAGRPGAPRGHRRGRGGSGAQPGRLRPLRAQPRLVGGARWRERVARQFETGRARSSSATRRTWAPGPSTCGVPASGVDDLIYLSCDVGVGGGIITGGRPLVGACGLRRRGGPRDASTRTARRVAAAPAAAGRPRSGSARCCAMRAATRTAGPREVDAVLRAAEAGDATALAAVAARRSLAGHRLWPVSSTSSTPRSWSWAACSGGMAPLVAADGARRAGGAGPVGRPRAGRASSRPRLGDDAPVMGAAERAFEPLLADPLRYAARAPVPR